MRQNRETLDVPLIEAWNRQAVILVERDESDDQSLIAILEGVLNELAVAQAPDEIHVLRIRDWFDSKWLGYSGRGVVDFPGASFAGIDVALDDVRQSELTVPPFNPNRILSQRSFRRPSKGPLELFVRQPLHKPMDASRNKNLHRRMTQEADSAVFAWLSTESASNQRAALMVYSVSQGVSTGWYASLVRNGDWSVASTTGISRSEAEALLSIGPTGRDI